MAKRAGIRIKLGEDLDRNTLTGTDQAEQDVLCINVVVTQCQRLGKGELQHQLGVRRERDGSIGGMLALCYELIHLLMDTVQ